MGYRYNTFCECVKEEENEAYYDKYDDVNKDDPHAYDTDNNKEVYNFDDADENDSYDFDEHNTYYYDNHDNINDDGKDALGREEDVEESDDSNNINDRHIKNKYWYSL